MISHFHVWFMNTRSHHVTQMCDDFGVIWRWMVVLYCYFEHHPLVMTGTHRRDKGDKTILTEIAWVVAILPTISSPVSNNKSKVSDVLSHIKLYSLSKSTRQTSSNVFCPILKFNICTFNLIFVSNVTIYTMHHNRQHMTNQSIKTKTKKDKEER